MGCIIHGGYQFRGAGVGRQYVWVAQWMGWTVFLLPMMGNGGFLDLGLGQGCLSWLCKVWFSKGWKQKL